MTAARHHFQADGGEKYTYATPPKKTHPSKSDLNKLSSPQQSLKLDSPPIEEPFVLPRVYALLEEVQLRKLDFENSKRGKNEPILDDNLPVFDEEFDLQLEESLVLQMLEPEQQTLRAMERYSQIKLFMTRTQEKERERQELRNAPRSAQSAKVSRTTPQTRQARTSSVCLTFRVPEEPRSPARRKQFTGFCDQQGNFYATTRSQLEETAIQSRKKTTEELGFFDRRAMNDAYQTWRKAYERARDLTVSIAEYEHQKWVYNQRELDPSIVASEFARILSIPQHDGAPVEVYASALALLQQQAR